MDCNKNIKKSMKLWGERASPTGSVLYNIMEEITFPVDWTQTLNLQQNKETNHCGYSITVCICV